MSTKKQTKEPSFEQDLAQLEVLAEHMEQGDLPLDELMTAYTEGTLLAQALQKRLERAKAQLSEVKMQKDGTVTVSPSTVAMQGSLLDDLNE